MNNDLNKIIEEKYENLTALDKQELYRIFQDRKTREDLKAKVETIIFRTHFPSPEEFLDPNSGWLSKKVIESIFPYIKEEFINIVHGDKEGDPYNRIAQYGSTRRGKTFLAHLLIIYIIIFHHCLRDNSRYYGLSPNTELAIYFVSFKYDKIKQVYLSPLYKILSNSKRFVKVLRSEQVGYTQEKVGLDKIVWSKTSTSGYITLQSGLQIQLGNDEAINALGASVCNCFISEISFFCEYGGTTEDSIFRTYIELHSRLINTVGKRFLAFTYLDSSANSANSKIEGHIIKELSNRKGTYFSWKSRWEALPNLYPIWQKTGKTFQIITGNNSIPAKIVTSKKDLIDVPVDLILDVPIDLKELFEDDLIGEIKNSAGRPTSDENRFINDIKYIDNLFSNKSLTNIEGSCIVDASSFPEKLLWNQIANKFFTKNASGRYMFKRAPDEPRWMSLDNAYSVRGDVAGFGCIHKEWCLEKKCVLYITDFIFVLIPGENGINLEAPIQFILDMRNEANVYVKGFFTDSFQSQTQIQQLERFGVNALKQSVDDSLNPYVVYLTNLINGTLKCGKNIFLKNNLLSLIRTRTGKDKTGKEKIDHTGGIRNNKYNGDFDHSTSGIHGKDASDAHAQCLFGAYNDPYIPSAIYQIEEKKFSTKTEDIKELTKDAFKKLHKQY